MARINTTEQTVESVQNLITAVYKGNAMADRCKSVLVADLAYNNLADLIHEFVAHWLFFAGDFIGVKIMERFGISVNYGGIPIYNKNYESVEEVLKDLLDMMIEIQDSISYTIHIAVQNSDRHVSSELFELMREFNIVIDECILLYDKILLYKTDPNFDAHVEKHMNIVDGKLKLLDYLKFKDIKLKE